MIIDAKVKFKNGLHSRECIELVELARQSKSEVLILRNDKKINCKSIIAVLTECIKEDEKIKFIINGSDESEVSNKIKEIFE